ncbi:MAG: thioesterase II family protein [Acidobacteriaceae bacterium]
MAICHIQAETSCPFFDCSVLPHVGGAPIAFFPWADWCGEDIECVCLQYRRRAQRLREEPLASIVEIVREISEDLAALSDKPFAFYGHSFGGIVAFPQRRADAMV